MRHTKGDRHLRRPRSRSPFVKRAQAIDSASASSDLLAARSRLDLEHVFLTTGVLDVELALDDVDLAVVFDPDLPSGRDIGTVEASIIVDVPLIFARRAEAEVF